MHRKAFTLIELLVVIAIIAVLAVVVVLTLNPIQLLAQSRDANRLSDMAMLQSALNLYTTDQSGSPSFSLGTTTNTYISVYDSQASSTCGSLGLPVFTSSTWACSSSSTYRLATSAGWIGVNFNNISSGSPLGSVPVDPVNRTSSGLFYAYNTNGTQFEVTAVLESSKYKSNYSAKVQTNMFPEVISGGTPGISALYNPSGLVGYWNFEEGSGAVAYDVSGNGNNESWQGGLTNGSYYGSGKVGYGGVFDGSSTYTTITTNPQLNFGTSSFTITLWFYPTTYPTTQYSNEAGLVTKITPSYSAGWETYLNSNGTIGMYVRSSVSNYAGNNSSFTAPLNQWSFATFIVDQSQSATRIFLNGVESVPSSSIAGFGNFDGATAMLFGATRSDLSHFNGAIDEVRIYNRTLSVAEIQALYNAQH